MYYDYLILGGGLAGSVAARTLALSGKRVLIVDRANLLEKDKLCGGLLTPRAVRMMERIYGPTTEALYRETHDRMRVLFGGHDHVIDGVRVRGLMRRDLDRFALRMALDAGVDALDDMRVDDIDFAGRRALLTTSEWQTSCSYGTLIAADGAFSTTRHMLSQAFDKAAQTSDAFAAQSTLRPKLDIEIVPSLEVFVEPNGQPLTGKYSAKLKGYCWYIPCGDAANIGCDGAKGTTREQLRAALEEFAEEVGVRVDDSRMRGAFIPSGGSVLLQCAVPGDHARLANTKDPKDCVYFIGDAAGLAAPATGEGIYYALASAYRLASSLVDQKGPRYGALMARDVMTLGRQYRMLPLLFDERIMESTISFSHISGMGSERMARFALKLFASF